MFDIINVYKLKVNTIQSLTLLFVTFLHYKNVINE